MRYARIAEQTIRRLPIYLRALTYWDDLGRPRISSRDLAESVGGNAGQVRKDLSYFGEFGTPGIGYEIKGLIHQIKRILRLDHPKPVALVGVGNLGSAVLAYGGFARYGLEITAAFDADSAKVGSTVQGLTIEAPEGLATLADRGIVLGIVAVPVGVAQGVVDTMIAAGVRGFLSFAACRLTVPSRVHVIGIDIAMDLASLPYYLPGS